MPLNFRAANNKESPHGNLFVFWTGKVLLPCLGQGDEKAENIRKMFPIFQLY